MFHYSCNETNRLFYENKMEIKDYFIPKIHKKETMSKTLGKYIAMTILIIFIIFIIRLY